MQSRSGADGNSSLLKYSCYLIIHITIVVACKSLTSVAWSGCSGILVKRLCSSRSQLSGENGVSRLCQIKSLVSCEAFRYAIINIGRPLRAFAAVQLNSYIAILATPKHKKKWAAAMELYLNFFCFLLQCTSIYRCALQLKAKMKYNFLFCVHTSFCIFYSFLPFGQYDILFYCSDYIILL